MKTLAATREVSLINRGKLQVFYKNVRELHTRITGRDFSDDRFYEFQLLENAQDKFIYIQEKQIDDFQRVAIKGGLLIHDRDFMKFIKELQRFALEISEVREANEKHTIV